MNNLLSTHFDTFFYTFVSLFFNDKKSLSTHFDTFFIHLHLYFQWTTPYRHISTHFYTCASLFSMKNPLSTHFDTFFIHLHLYFQWTTPYRHISTHSLYISTCRFSFPHTLLQVAARAWKKKSCAWLAFWQVAVWVREKACDFAPIIRWSVCLHFGKIFLFCSQKKFTKKYYGWELTELISSVCLTYTT